MFDLDRFVQAQDPIIERVQDELRAGHKRSHWMWFVFPQLAGLGHSAMARHYAIASRAEAEAYMAHPVLGPRLLACTGLVNGVAGRSVHQIFGSPDGMKFHSCVTLFAETSGNAVFQDALAKSFAGKRDAATVDLLGRL